MAALNDGFSFIGLEKEPEYVKISEARLNNANNEKDDEGDNQ